MPEEQLRRAEVYGKWWPGPPLNYRELKKLALQHASGFRDDVDQKFFALLQDEIPRINKCPSRKDGWKLTNSDGWLQHRAFLRLAHAALRDNERRQLSNDREAQETSRRAEGRNLAPELPVNAKHPCRARICNEYAQVITSNTSMVTLF